ncbi:GNAT family N-acetyltransferase [Pseudalkalibacillus hwajinpoensis]|uniref:GNAT family N-acetyltransferase n=1 Tax=Guptibacillus hwajinpoensis TaxID=208199 RepID=UPI001CD738B8|nr:GNAT family N-acetyltransferase [Pseudalkalibacillus hwajinpoensis]MCA0993220.1 GNAT family N-acetyltransferase [Pseudalkalibacillus hwajinpoensis]
MPYLQTDRLTIIPFSFDLIKAMTNKKELEKLLHVEVPEEFNNVQFEQFLPFHLTDGTISSHRWEGILIHTSDEKVIGTMGYNNIEATNNLEVGYHLIPDYRNKGYAIEMANALVSWAFPDKESNEGKEEMNNVMDRIGLSKLTVEPHLLRNKIDEEKFIKENEYM